MVIHLALCLRSKSKKTKPLQKICTEIYILHRNLQFAPKFTFCIEIYNLHRNHFRGVDGITTHSLPNTACRLLTTYLLVPSQAIKK
jgi:hypothetical protein